MTSRGGGGVSEQYRYEYGRLGWAFRCTRCGTNVCGYATKTDAEAFATAGDCSDHFPDITQEEARARRAS